MCPSIILTTPLCPNVCYIFVYISFHHHFMFSLFIKSQPLLLLLEPLFLLLFFGSSECSSLRRTLIYFLFFFFSASLLSPYGQVSYNFYSLVLPARLLSLLHLLSPLIFTSFQLTSLTPCCLSALISWHLLLFSCCTYWGFAPCSFYSSSYCISMEHGGPLVF